MMLDILGSHAEMAELQAELGAILSTSPANSTNLAGSNISHAGGPSLSLASSTTATTTAATVARSASDADAARSDNNNSNQQTKGGTEGAGGGGERNDDPTGRRRRGFFELWRSRRVFPPFSRVRLRGVGAERGGSAHNYFVVVVNQVRCAVVDRGATPSVHHAAPACCRYAGLVDSHNLHLVSSIAGGRCGDWVTMLLAGRIRAPPSTTIGSGFS